MVLAAMTMALLVAGCASRPEADALTPALAQAADAKPHTLLVATTRARDPNPGAVFSGERAGGKLDFASLTLTVPPTHKPGDIEWAKQQPGNPKTDMVVREASYRDTDQDFIQSLNAELAKRPVGERKVFVFVHGYNTSFPEAVFRLTQMVHDSEGPGVPVLFTWASRGKVEDYVYDTNSATAARDNLERTLNLIVASQAEEITILAHSMGNWVTMETLRQMKISGHVIPSKRLGKIILASPDIDVDVFKAQLKRYGKPDKPFIVIVSHDDKALGLSDLLAGGKQRLGAYSNDAELASLGVVVVDMTDVKAQDRMNHGKFAQLAQMVPQLKGALAKQAASAGETLKEDLSAEGIKVSGLEQLSAPSTSAK